MFDFANSSYTTVIVTVAFSVFFTSLVAAGPRADAWWGRGIFLSNLIVVLLSPICGAIPAPVGCVAGARRWCWRPSCRPRSIGCTLISCIRLPR